MEQILDIEKEKYTNLPLIRFPDFKQKWLTARLEDLSDRIGDGLHGTPEYVDNSNIYFINGNNLINGKVEITENTKSVSLEISKKNNKKLNGNTILLSINGTIGNCAIYRDEKVMLGKSVAYLKFYDNSIFYYYLLDSDKIKAYFKSNVTGTTIKNLSLKTIRETIVRVPSRSEQIKIATFLSSVDEKLQTLNKKKHLLEEYKKGVMQKLFSQELRFKDEDGKEYPKWELKKLNEVCTIRSGLSCDQSSLKNGLRVTRIETISEGIININRIGYIDQKERIEDYRILEGDILFSNINSVTHIGKTAIAFEDMDIYHGMNLLCLRSQVGFHPFFIFHYLNTIRVRTYFKQICNQAVNQASINQTQLGQTQLLFPCLTEQILISNILSSFNEKITRIGQQIEKSQLWKKGLLQKMFC